MRNYGTVSQRLMCWFKNGLEGQACQYLLVWWTWWWTWWNEYDEKERTDSQRLTCRFKNVLEGQVIWWERWDWLTVLGVLVRKWLEGAGLAGLIGRVELMMNMMKWIWWKIWYYLPALRVLFFKWLGGAGLSVLVGWVDPMQTGRCGWIDGWGRLAGRVITI